MDSDQAKKNRTTHGLRYSPEYNHWRHMKGRCYNPNNHKYKNYGGRGITVCERWHDFLAFYEDMGPRPSKHHSIDRIDNDGDYCPENCRWATVITQSRNKRNVTSFTYNGKTMTVPEWAEHLGVRALSIHARLNRGWSVEEALGRPFTRSNGYRNHA